MPRARKRHLRSRASSTGLPIPSITTHNGNEQAKPAAIAQTLGCGLYFADPKSPHQRGTSENTKGRLRELFHKNRNLTTQTTKDFSWVVWQIKHRPQPVFQLPTKQRSRCYNRPNN